MAVTAHELQRLNERTSTLDWDRTCVDRCHCCDIFPASAGGVLCNICRAITETESES